MDDVVPRLVKVPCYTQLSLQLLSRACLINPANVSSRNKGRDRGGSEGLEGGKNTAEGWACPRDESLLLLKKRLQSFSFSLAHEHNQAMHRVKATHRLCVQKGDRRENISMDLVGIGTRRGVTVTFQLALREG